MQQKLFFTNSKGDKLCGLLSNPTNDKTQKIVIICHGFASNKNSPNFITMSEEFDKLGISTFRIDVYGHGESEGDFAKITITEAVNDILQAIQFLKNQGYSKIGLIGSSFGGISSIMVASQTKDLFALALKSPVSNYEEVEKIKYSNKELTDWEQRGWIYYPNREGQKLRLNYSFLEDFKNNNGYEAAPRIEIPTLIVHGDKDTIVPIEQSIKTSKLIKNCKLKIIEGADHIYTDPENAKEMIKTITEFINSI